MALAFVAPADRAAITERIYGRSSGYREGGNTFKAGLFDWERRAIAEAPFPRVGTVLLGGAGGGRELAALSTLGYEVVAFEPSEGLATGAAAVARAHPGAHAVKASYADFITAVERGEGPIASAVAGRTFDAVILGWASWSHILEPGERLELLRATRRFAPEAPLLLSYLPSDAGSDNRLSGWRRFLGLLGAPNDGSSPDGFFPWSGFHRLTSEQELREVATATGYEVHWVRRTPYSHAMLVPNPTRTNPD